MHEYRLSLIISVLIATALPVLAAVGSPEAAVTTKLALSTNQLRQGSSFELAVVSTVKEGYHIGAHDSDLYPAKLTLTAPKAIVFSEPGYPKGQRKAFAFAPDSKLSVYEGRFVIRIRGRVAKDAKPGNVVITANLDSQACKGNECYPPQIATTQLATKIVSSAVPVKKINNELFPIALQGPRSNADQAGSIMAQLAGASIVVRFLLLFLFGLLLAFTPCVYPMIPVTVGYFGSQSHSSTKRVTGLAGVYVLGLALTYSILGAVAATTGGMFGAAMQHPAVIIFIALVLVTLALSMFGMYEIRPPTFIANRATGKGGVFGALLMGLIFGIVVAPCAGPVVIGLMLFVAKLGSPPMGFMMFFTLALGLGTPLFILATFSAKMPVPGMWMVAVKKLAGFLLLGAAAAFAQPIIPESIYRFLIPAIVLTAGLYLGFFEKSLKASRITSSFGKAGSLAAFALAVFLMGSTVHRPSLKWETYSPEKVAQAAHTQQPVMIDFTASWCAACRELEHGPFTDPKIIGAASKFTRLRVDGSDRSNKIALIAGKQYSVKGYPTVIFIDSTGKEVRSARIVGFVNSKDMMRRIRSVTQ